MVSRVAVVGSLALQHYCSTAASVISERWCRLLLLPSALRRLFYCCEPPCASLITLFSASVFMLDLLPTSALIWRM